MRMTTRQKGLEQVFSLFLDLRLGDFTALQKVLGYFSAGLHSGEWKAEDLMGAAVSILYWQPVRLAHESRGDGNWWLEGEAQASGFLTWFQQTP